jgi:hypothetical protein
VTRSLRTLAAANNAELCDLVCRTHGLDPEVDEVAWTSPVRTPPYYPDAVTLAGDGSIHDLLARIDVGPGCSIKDSFSVLDLVPHGFRALFDAEWMARPPAVARASTASEGWTVVRGAKDFASWESAWRGEEGDGGVLLVDLLGQPSTVVIAARVGGRVVAGALLTCSKAVVGISNFFGAGPGPDPSAWEGCVAFVASLFPETILVGYASGEALAAARATGFETVGRLRVWVAEDSGGGSGTD